jgi:negative regulator of sigma E activity
MIAASDEARAAFAEAARLDAVLDQAPPPPPADRLGWRLRGIGPRPEQIAATVARPRAGWMGNLARAAAVVLAVAGGVAIGVTLPERQSGQSQEVAFADGEFATQLPLTVAYEDADETGTDSGVTLAGYIEDDYGLPLQ